MGDEPKNTTIQSMYAQRLADDLEANRKAQADITERLVGLQERLAQLRSDGGMLAVLQEALSASAGAGAAPPAADQCEPAGNAPVPAVTRAETTAPKPRRPKPATGKKAATGAAAKKAGKELVAEPGRAKKTAEPVLGVLLKRILDKRPGEPRTAGEICTDLEQQYSERSRNVNIVRNTLERLVSQSAIERSRQGRTVMYTSPAPEPGSVVQAPDADASPVADGGLAEGSERVPASV